LSRPEDAPVVQERALALVPSTPDATPTESSSDDCTGTQDSNETGDADTDQLHQQQQQYFYVVPYYLLDLLLSTGFPFVLRLGDWALRQVNPSILFVALILRFLFKLGISFARMVISWLQQRLSVRRNRTVTAEQDDAIGAHDIADPLLLDTHNSRFLVRDTYGTDRNESLLAEFREDGGHQNLLARLRGLAVAQQLDEEEEAGESRGNGSEDDDVGGEDENTE